MSQRRVGQAERAVRSARPAETRSGSGVSAGVLGVLMALAVLMGLLGGFLLFLAFPGSPPEEAAAPPTAIPATASRPIVVGAQPTDRATEPVSTPTGEVRAATPRPTTEAGLQVTPAPTPLGGGTSPPAAALPISTSGVPNATAAAEDPRVEQALRGLTTDQARVGQLLLLGWAGETAEAARPMLQELQPGGIIFLKNADRAAEATQINGALRRMAGELAITPPLLTLDHEGGDVQRIKDVPNIGANQTFGRLRPTDRQACERGLTHARQLQSMGFTMNLAPVLDVVNNPSNPAIGDRSYGADPELVARLGSAYIRGLQAGGIAAVGKHFPGHGNTDIDTHLDLPILQQTQADLERIELVPFRRAIGPETNVAGIMSAHIVFPAIDPSRMPATLSRPVMTGLLRDALGFHGLAVSDDIGAMKAITSNFTPGQAAVQAVGAGIDLLIIGGDLARQRESRDALLAAVESGGLGRARLDEAVRRVLRVKARFGLLGGPVAAGGGCS